MRLFVVVVAFFVRCCSKRFSWNKAGSDGRGGGKNGFSMTDPASVCSAEMWQIRAAEKQQLQLHFRFQLQLPFRFTFQLQLPYVSTAVTVSVSVQHQLPFQLQLELGPLSFQFRYLNLSYRFRVGSTSVSVSIAVGVLPLPLKLQFQDRLHFDAGGGGFTLLLCVPSGWDDGMGMGMDVAIETGNGMCVPVKTEWDVCPCQDGGWWDGICVAVRLGGGIVMSGGRSPTQRGVSVFICRSCLFVCLFVCRVFLVCRSGGRHSRRSGISPPLPCAPSRKGMRGQNGQMTKASKTHESTPAPHLFDTCKISTAYSE